MQRLICGLICGLADSGVPRSIAQGYIDGSRFVRKASGRRELLFGTAFTVCFGLRQTVYEIASP